MKSLTYVEIDIDWCANSFGVAPCTAAISADVPIKCFNCANTCADRVNYVEAGATLRFAIDTSYLPSDIDCIPSIAGVSYTPARISLGQNLGQRASLTVSFRDHRHSDVGDGFDKYVTERGYDPFARGTFFGKFRARHPFVRGKALRLIRGFLGDALEDMETLHLVMDSFDGPTPDGTYTLVAKDALKLADNDRAQAPAISNGALLSDITAADTELTMNPAGIGDEEYPLEGYVNLGGQEIVAFNRDGGNDTYTKLLLQFGGADASTTFTDSSASAHTVTANGNAQIDNAQSKFGGTSGLFDGTTDYLSLDGSASFAFGAGDFSIDFQLRLNAVGAQRDLYDSRPSGGTGLYPHLLVTSGNVLAYEVNGSNRITGTTVLAAGAWHHVALARSNGVTSLFLDGVLEGSTYADANNYLVGTNRPTIGASGNSAGANSLNGWLDILRVSKGIARWTTTFAPPASAYSSSSSDVLKIRRAQYETDASAHSAEDRVQLCLRYTAKDPAYILNDLLTNYTDIDPDWVPYSDWSTEVASYLARVYTAIIAAPVGINTLCSELVEQAALAMWWDPIEQLLRLQVLRSVPADAAGFDQNNILEGTFKVSEQPNARVSEVWTHYGQRNPLKNIDQADNYRSIVATVDLQGESDYGSSAIKKIYSRWIAAFGKAIAERLNNVQIGRYKVPPRKFSYELLRPATAILGSGYYLSGPSMQDATGAQNSAPAQVTVLNPSADRVAVEAEEALFVETDDDFLTARVITIDGNFNNFNLRTVHDTLYPEITDPTGLTLTCIVGSNVIVGSADTASRAFDVGDWVASLNITIKILGRIQGAGGKGADGRSGASSAPPSAGAPGGTALYTRYPINLVVVDGQLWGGGGGGPGGGGKPGTGGGGAGQLPGAGGVISGPPPAYQGQPGTTEAGGDAGVVDPGQSRGGNGGGPGLPGQTVSFGGTPGAAGRAIDGISYVTIVGGAGDRRGGEVN